MDDRLQALLDAHVAFELKQWRGKTLDKHLAAEASALWRWAEDLPLNQLADVERVQAAARRLALDLPLPDTLAETIAAMTRHLLRLSLNRETTVSEVLDQAVFEEGVELVAGLEQARTALIRGVSDNPVYAALASELIYNGIKDYLFSDQALLKRIPGVSSLVSAGTSAVSRGAPGLEDQVEKRVRGYIESNLASTLERSEEFLLAALTPERIRELGDQLWDLLADRPLAIDHALTDADIEALVHYGHRLWGQLRETEYVVALVDEGVAHFFTLHGDDSVASLLERVGVTEDVLIDEACTLLPPLVEVACETGFLEGFVRRRLAPFYRSQAAADALG